MQELMGKIANYNYVFVFGCGNVGRHTYMQLIEDKVNAAVRFCNNYYSGGKCLKRKC
jgi:hypothetical protein